MMFEAIVTVSPRWSTSKSMIRTLGWRPSRSEAEMTSSAKSRAIVVLPTPPFAPKKAMTGISRPSREITCDSAGYCPIMEVNLLSLTHRRLRRAGSRSAQDHAKTYVVRGVRGWGLAERVGQTPHLISRPPTPPTQSKRSASPDSPFKDVAAHLAHAFRSVA